MRRFPAILALAACLIAGCADAFSARRQARALGMPDSRPIDFAVDCDCSSASIFYYFVGVGSGMASVEHVPRAVAVQRVGIYGGYDQVSGAHASGLVGN